MIREVNRHHDPGRPWRPGPCRALVEIIAPSISLGEVTVHDGECSHAVAVLELECEKLKQERDAALATVARLERTAEAAKALTDALAALGVGS